MVVDGHDRRDERTDRQRDEEDRERDAPGKGIVGAYNREWAHEDEDESVPEREVLVAFGAAGVEVAAEEAGGADEEHRQAARK